MAGIVKIGCNNNNLTFEEARKREQKNLHGKLACKSNWFVTDNSNYKVSKRDFQNKLNKLSK